MKVEMKEDLIDKHVRFNTEMTKWKIEIGDQIRGDNNQKTTGQLTTAHHVDEDKGIGHKAEEEQTITGDQEDDNNNQVYKV